MENAVMFLRATSFSNSQVALIAGIVVLFVALTAANAFLLYLFLHKRQGRRRLCTDSLQQRREQLLEELTRLRMVAEQSGVTEEDEEEDEEDEEEDDDAAEEDADAGEEEADDGDLESDAVPLGETFRAEVLAVRDMSLDMRKKFGFLGEEFARKCYYVRTTYGFEAKLRAASDEVKERYTRISDEFGRWEKATVRRGFRRERVAAGRKTVAYLLFRGKTLCVALALDPKQYENTKYRGKDVSSKKCFASTPMLIRVTSARRANYVCELIAALAHAQDMPLRELYKSGHDLSPASRDDLFAAGQVKLSVLGEAPDLEEFDEDENGFAVVGAPAVRAGILAACDMSDKMRRDFGIAGPEYDFKRYYVRYGYGFDAKLRAASEEMKARYASFADEIGWYKKLRLGDGFRRKRIAYGRKTAGFLLFKGKTLCVALALDPKQFENTKYRGVDVSRVKCFAATPMLIKLTSARRLGYAEYLLNRLAEAWGMTANAAPEKGTYSLEPMTRDELYARNLLKISVIGEVPESVSAER